MYSKSAHLYDAIYSFKKFDREVEWIISIVEAECPHARTLVDVACGPHEHARVLKGRFSVDGLDINPDFLPIAKSKNPLGEYFHADMRSFDLGRKYDVLLCLSSSIGYLRDAIELRATIARFSKHIQPDGLILIEPWYTPASWTPDRIAVTTGDQDGLKVVRVGVRTSSGTKSKIRFHYMVVSLDHCEVFYEDHELHLFSMEDFAGAFEDAGLKFRHLPEWSKGRGLYIASRK